MPITDFLRLVWHRRLLFAAVCALVLAATAAIALKWPRSYAATTRVMIDTGKARDAVLEASPQQAVTPGLLATQVDVIRSQRVALEAVRLLGFERSEVARRLYLKATGGRGTLEQFFAERLIDRVRIQPSQQSTVIEITLRAPDARFAAEAANAVARAYIATQLELKVQPAREFAEFYETQVKTARERFETAQRRLSRHQRSTGIVSVDERLDVESRRLDELSSQLTQLQAVRSESAEKAGAVARMREGGPSLPDVLNNPVIAQLRSEIARGEAKLTELGNQFGPRYPTVERARDELAALRAELARHVEAVGGSLARQHEVNLAREADLRDALAAQRTRVMTLKRQRDEMAVLVRDVESAQRALDLLQTRMMQNTVESQSRGASAVHLDPAVEPLEPTSPNVTVVVLVGLVTAPLLGLLAVAIVGAVRRRALVPADLERALGCPVLATVPRSRAVRRASAPRRALSGAALAMPWRRIGAARENDDGGLRA
ncbi:MAG: Wzz/FepE/Etk N-terminal domain-containing protein [Burkholderiales bacterium]|jgi:chain length determinant protein EpsF